MCVIVNINNNKTTTLTLIDPETHKDYTIQILGEYLRRFKQDKRGRYLLDPDSFEFIAEYAIIKQNDDDRLRQYVCKNHIFESEIIDIYMDAMYLTPDYDQHHTAMLAAFNQIDQLIKENT